VEPENLVDAAADYAAELASYRSPTSMSVIKRLVLDASGSDFTTAVEQTHRGMRVCRVLNSGQPPREVAEGLRSTGKAMAILNDWGQFASVLGDTETHLAAAEEALRQARTTDQVRPWNLEMLSRHLSQAHLSRGDLGEALRQARNARQYAVAGARELEGMPSRETMDAFDDSAAALSDVAIRLEGYTAVANVLDELVAIHDRQRKVLESLNRGANVVSYPGPTEATRPEELLDGEPSALVALGEGRPRDAVTLMSRHRILGPPQGLIMLRALQELSDVDNAAWLLDDMKDLYGRNDDIPMLAELALREAAVSEPEGDLAIIEPWLVAADELGLGLLWTDLTLARTRALLAQDDLVRAASAARAAFDRCMSGGYRMGARQALKLLDSAGAETSPDEVAWAHRPGWDPGETPLARKPPRTIPSIGPDRRSDLDSAARQVLKDYVERKVPFVLYLRAFAVTVWHGPKEFGLQLLENVVSGAIAGFANVITIQDQNLSLYSGSGSPSDRTAPALLLGNEQWQEVAEQLIMHADLIVSEALVLSPGVRYELERIYANGAWGRTVLVLPPLGGELPELDGDPLIQLFPRCVWAEDFHTIPFERHAVSAPLLDRLNRIAADPEAEHPLDLTELARHYESTAKADEVFLHSDDPDFADRRYRSFWRHFRANSIRLISAADGVPLSDTDRLSIANNYLHMASIMLDATAEGDRYVVTGDIEFAQLAAHQAYVLYGPDLLELQSLAAQKLQLAQRLTQALADGDPRFIVRPRYGRIITSEG
jgi:hypothetical protein